MNDITHPLSSKSSNQVTKAKVCQPGDLPTGFVQANINKHADLVALRLHCSTIYLTS